MGCENGGAAPGSTPRPDLRTGDAVEASCPDASARVAGTSRHHLSIEWPGWSVGPEIGRLPRPHRLVVLLRTGHSHDLTLLTRAGHPATPDQAPPVTDATRTGSHQEELTRWTELARATPTRTPTAG